MSDEELVTRLKANDDDAYREVVSRYGDALYGYVYGITGDAHLSEDILSETYLRMVEKIDSYHYYGAPFKAWLYRIAHNQALNILRRGKRIVSGDGALEQAAISSNDPATMIEAQLDAEELRAALQELTDDQQQVVLLRFLANQSTSEVAQALNKNENAIKQLQLRALRSLGRLLDRRG